MLHIGVSSFQVVSPITIINEEGFLRISDEYLKPWVLPVFEIDYVRVYGENVKGLGRNDTFSNTSNDLPRIDSSIIYALIGEVIIFAILIIIVIYYFRRNLEQTNNQDNYDDIRDPDNKYDEFDYIYAYAAAHYTNEQIYQAPANEYLVLTDPLADNLYQNQNYHKLSKETEV